MTRIRTLVDKEWADIFKNRLVLFVVAFLPLLFTLIALGQLAAARYLPSEATRRVPAGFKHLCQQQGLADSDCLQGLMSSQFMLLFLLLPLIVPVTIAAYSIVGEKIARSLEPLLATPVSTAEIVLGKGLAAALPAIASTWLAFGIFREAAYFIASDAVYRLIADPKWWVAMTLLAPLLSVFSVNVAIMISARVNEPRAAEQLSMLVMLPLLVMLVAPIAGWVTLTLGGVLAAAAALLALDAVLVAVGVRLFRRETILTRWRW